MCRPFSCATGAQVRSFVLEQWAGPLGDHDPWSPFIGSDGPHISVPISFIVAWQC
jgi:hypothetical protein